MKSKVDDPQNILNRELSWCEFNHRVLEEAMDSNNPLLERIRFAAIVASNLDEFFMVRVASLRHKIADGDSRPDPSGMTAAETFKAVSTRIEQMMAALYQTVAQLLPQVAEAGISIRSFDALTADEKGLIESKFENEIFPVLTPMAIDPTHPFPILVNLSLNIGVLLAPASGEDKKRLAVVPIPPGLPRLLQVG
ncbi:MAG: RNA degradosome polyphosphate kinase, partial [Acidobacteria bacterium]